MARTIIVDEIKKDSSDTPMSVDGIAKAWIQGDSASGAIDSMNVSSTVDEANAVSRINYTAQMATANYACVVSAARPDTAANNRGVTAGNVSTSHFYVGRLIAHTGSWEDGLYHSHCIGDLA